MKIENSGILSIFCILSLICSLPVALTADEEYKYEGAEVCSSCHEEAYREWKDGPHAKSWNNLIYHAARAGYIKATAAEGGLHCEDCHSPIASMTVDEYLLNPISTEGVTCDVCHTMAADEKSGFKKFLPQGGKEKAGPTGDCPSDLHPCRKEDRLTTSEFCAVCHHYVNRYGVPIYTEYSEWKSSRFGSEGITCLDCHTQRGKVGERSWGVHRLIPLEGDRGLLRQALSLDMELKTAWDYESVLTVRVRNTGAGHAVPGGPPIRSIRLEVKAYDANDDLVFADTSKVMSRAVESPISPDTGLTLPWLGWSVVSDERIFPGETRVFNFKTGRQDVVRATARLLYHRFSMMVEEDFFPDTEPPVMTTAEVKAK